MKKSLLLLSVAAFASMANAQVVVGLATSDEFAAAGLSGDKVDMQPVTILDNEAGTFGLAYKDSWGTTTTYKTYRNVTVEGEAIQLGTGAVGNTNPSFVSYEAGVMSAGAVFIMEAKKDGYMTVFTKLNPNKQYVVFEGKTQGAAYTLGWTNGTQTIHYALPCDEDGVLDLQAADAGKYFVMATQQATDANGVKLWKDADGNVVAADTKPEGGSAVMENLEGQSKPAMPWNVADFESAPGESTGFLSFEVLKGNTYYFSALGSKAACGGFVYTEENPTIVFEEVLAEDGSVANPKVEFPAMVNNGGESAVQAIATVESADAPVYNMLGVRVNSDAKGILIQNGKKFIRK